MMRLWAVFSINGKGLTVWQTRDKAKPLTPEQEGDLINFTVAHHLVLLSNLGLVLKEAPALRAGGLAGLDVVNEGIIGLDRAIAGFDHTQGYKFSSYATKFIKGKIRRAIANQVRIVRLPVHAHEKYGEMLGERKKLTQESGQEPTDDELIHHYVEQTGIKSNEAWAIWNAGPYALTSLDTPLDEESDSSTVGDHLLGGNTYDTRAAEELTAKLAIEKVLHSDRLKDRDKLILILTGGISENLPALEVKVEQPIESEPGKMIDYRHYIGRAALVGGFGTNMLARIFGISAEGARLARKKAFQNARGVIREEFGNLLDS